MPGFGHTLASARPEPGGLIVFALGQAGFALRGADALVLDRPWLSTALEEEEGITRPVAPALRPDEVEAADLVCITHEHADHLDPRTLAAIAERVPGGDLPRARRRPSALVERAGVPRGADPSRPRRRRARGRRRARHRARGRARAAPGRVRRLPLLARRARRPSRPRLPGRARRPPRSSTPATRSGGRAWRTPLRELDPDVAILPINGRDAMREAQGLWGNLSADEAAALAVAAGVPAVGAVPLRRRRGQPGRPGRRSSPRCASAAPQHPRARAASGGRARPRRVRLPGVIAAGRTGAAGPGIWQPRRRCRPDCTTCARAPARRSCCSPGIGSSGAAWRPVVPRLAAEREVWRVDLPGFGRSEALPAGDPCGIEALADAAERFFDEAGLERPHVAGNSLGGAVGLELGRRDRSPRSPRSRRPASPAPPDGCFAGRSLAVHLLGGAAGCGRSRRRRSGARACGGCCAARCSRTPSGSRPARRTRTS